MHVKNYKYFVTFCGLGAWGTSTVEGDYGPTEDGSGVVWYRVGHYT